MSVNKFGQFSNELYSTARSHRQVQTGLKRTRDGDFDAGGKRIINVAIPGHENDVSNRSYIDSEIFKFKSAIADLTKKLNGNKTKTAENKQTVLQLKGKIAEHDTLHKNIDSVISKLRVEYQADKNDLASELSEYKKKIAIVSRKHAEQEALQKSYYDQLILQDGKITEHDTLHKNYYSKLEVQKLIPEIIATQFDDIQKDFRNKILLDTSKIITDILETKKREILNIDEVLRKNFAVLKYTVITNLILNLKQNKYFVLNNNSDNFIVPLNGKITQILYSTKQSIDVTVNSSMPLLKNDNVLKGDKIQFHPGKTAVQIGGKVQFNAAQTAEQTVYVEIRMLSSVIQ